MDITPETTFAELLGTHPEANDVLLRFGLNCLGCPVGEYGTLQEGAAIHELDLQALIAALREFLSDP
jgi:hybrid cluster-associated redox disulfide protein